MSAAGSRGDNIRSVQDARNLQSKQKDKRDWSGAIDEQIRIKLVGTATVHANDLDGLGIPAEHRNLIGTRMARYCNKGWMEPTTERRKVEHPAANGRKNPVYRITRKGWQQLSARVRASTANVEGASNLSPVPGRSTCPDPGAQSRPAAGVPASQGLGSDTNPAVPSTSDKKGGSPAVTSKAAGDSARSLEDAAGVGAGGPLSQDEADPVGRDRDSDSTTDLFTASVDPGGIPGSSGVCSPAPEDAARPLFELPPECPGHDRIREAA